VNRTRVILTGALLAALLMLGGCAAEPESTVPAQDTPAEAVDLSGTSWDCYEFSVGATPIPVLSTAPITAEFSSDGKLTGSSGVNTYSTTYVTDGDTIQIGQEIVSTKMAGPEDAMKQESDFLVTLPTATTFNISSKGDLILFGPADNMIARFTPAE